MAHKFLLVNDKLNYLQKYNRVVIYTLILIFVAVGHYFIMQMPLEHFRYIRKSVISMMACLCLGGSFILMTRGERDRARNLFAFVMLVVGLTSFVSLIKGLTTGYAGVVEYKFLSLPMLIYGCIIAYIFLLYPLEAFRPGWLTLRRAILLFLPTVAFLGIYVFVIKRQNAPMPEIDNWTDLIHEFWNLNVWFPLLVLSYPIFGVVVMLRYRSNYEQWCENNYASMENIDVKWLGDYIFGNLVFSLSSQVVVLSNNVCSVLMHNIIFLAFFLYGFYRVLFHKSPYPEGYFKDGMNETKAEIREAMKLGKINKNADNPIDISLTPDNELTAKSLFVDKLPEYRARLEQWMETEKPYLRKDFKLTDTMEVLPLNRSYLSRLFNEGYGETFYQFVMRYRIAESKRLLLSRPDLNITNIADLSGFSSLSVFSRAFVNEVKCSPIQWREKKISERV